MYLSLAGSLDATPKTPGPQATDPPHHHLGATRCRRDVCAILRDGGVGRNRQHRKVADDTAQRTSSAWNTSQVDGAFVADGVGQNAIGVGQIFAADFDLGEERQRL